MAATFKILQNISPTDFKVGDVRNSDEFPPHTDFVRLVNLGAIRPTDLSAMPPEEADRVKLMDQLEELSQKHAESQDDAARVIAGHEEAAKKAAEDLKALRDRLSRSELGHVEKDQEIKRLTAELEAAKKAAAVTPSPAATAADPLASSEVQAPAQDNTANAVGRPPLPQGGTATAPARGKAGR